MVCTRKLKGCKVEEVGAKFSGEEEFADSKQALKAGTTPAGKTRKAVVGWSPKRKITIFWI